VAHDLLWPGTHRAGELMSDPALLRAMVRVEAAWLAELVAAGVAPPDAADDLAGLVDGGDVAQVAAAAEAGGNPVIPLLGLLRTRLAARNPAAATWVHRGLTSQDVLDTALALGAADVVARLRAELRAQVALLSALADAHRGTVMVARTLTQHAVPTTFGAKAAGWLHGVLDAAESLAACAGLPVQIGGAAGTLAASAELAALRGSADPAGAAIELAARTAERLGLRAAPPWHTARAPVARLGDALVACTDACGRIANDVLTLARPEIGELGEPRAPGRGGSSAMPHKVNPVLSVLVRRAALAAPHGAAALHTAAADARDERPDGAWHLEWATLRTLARRTVVAASQTAELLGGLRVDVERMRATARGAAPAILAEWRDLRDAAGAPGLAEDLAEDPARYLGATDALIDAALSRARDLEEPP